MKNYNNYNGIKCIENNTIYTSVTEAAKDLHIAKGGIYKVLQGKYAETSGYHFEAVADHNEPKTIILQHKSVVKGKGKCCGGNTNATLNITKAKVYTSATDAAEDINATPCHVSLVCNNGTGTVKGNRLIYVKNLPEHLEEVLDAFNKAVMYDELMTKEEKRSALLSEVHKWEDEIANIESEIANLHENLKEAYQRLEEAKYNVINFK